MSQLSLLSSEQELKDGPPVLETDRTVLPETGKRGGTACMVDLQGNGGGKDLEEAEVSGDLWSISSRRFVLSSNDVRAFTKMCLCNFFFFFFLR